MLKYGIKARDAEAYEAAEPYKRTIAILIDKKTMNAQNLIMGLGEMEPGKQIKPHVHEVEEEAYWILSGKGVAIIGEEKFEVEPEMSIFVPPKTMHQIINTGNTPLRWLWVMAPPGSVADQIRGMKRVK
ncbi:MAG: cupin domain-containing protein [Candidatus Bathyarchaeota archaeon]|nr:cupin domain-containing protein [Candidatus Bathyarchaeota archaeon]MDW8040355.1 cupin domain-containing protein [Nitrososphaerota archaeon]